eukprot:jgi/Mesvir1/23745/Mv18683-RA.1
MFSFAESSDGCQPELPSKVDHASANAITSQVDLRRLAQDAEHFDADASRYLPGLHDYSSAAVVSAMVGLLDMLEASVGAGCSQLSWLALPILSDCRESIVSFPDNVRQCASSLHALGAQLQHCEATAGSGHSCAPEVEMVYQFVLRIRESSPGAEMELAESLLCLAKYYRAGNRLDEAITYFQRCAFVISCQMGDGHPSVAAALNFLADSLAHANRFNEAEYACKRAVAIAADALGEDHHHTQGYRRNLEEVRAMREYYATRVASLAMGRGVGQ